MNILDIHPQKQLFLNKEAIRVAQLIKKIEEPDVKRNRDEIQGSIAHMQAEDWSDKLIGSSIHKTLLSVSSKEILSIKECDKKNCIGYDEDTYKEFKKLIFAANKEMSINSLITREKLEEASFRWAIDFYKKLNVPDYVAFLSDFIDENTFLYKIHFPVSNLHISSFIKIGNVNFEFFTKEYFDYYQYAFLTKNPNHSDPEIFSFLRKNYQGHVFATYTIKASRDKAIQIAFEKCSLAIDILKTCSNTTMLPNEVLGFDIDSRIKFAPRSEIISTKPDDITEFKIDMTGDQHPYNIDNNQWKLMNMLNLKLFSDFIQKTEGSSSELENLITNSITRYGIALSHRDLHQRVVELYTILESLLLNDESSPIIDSVAKYLSMLVEKTKENRYKCAKLIRSMYKVRSSLIHHAKKINFEVDDLRDLQLYVVNLLIILISKSDLHKYKRSILNEIDDAIMGAY